MSILSGEELSEEDFYKLRDMNDNLDDEETESEKLLCVYRNIVDSLKNYCDINEKYYSVIAVWIIGTYYHNLFPTYPYLFFNAMKGSGKSRLMRLITYLSKDGSMLNSPTEAVLFRENGTLGIDEFEGLGRKGKESLRELLNSAYKKGTKVKRMRKVIAKDGENQEVQEFNVYRPIVMANISGMEDVLGDRCIQLIIDKSNNPVYTKKMEIYENDTLIQEIKKFPFEKCRKCRVVTINKVYREWNTYIDTYYIHNINNTNNTNNTLFNKIINTEINGRQLELSLPLLLIGNLINKKIFEELLLLFCEISEEKNKEDLNENIDVSLIDFVSQIPTPSSWLSLKETLKKFKESIQNEEDWLNERWFGRALKRLNLVKDKKRMNYGRLIILDIEKAQEKIRMFK